MSRNRVKSFSTFSTACSRYSIPIQAPLTTKDTKGLTFPPRPGKSFDKYFVTPKPKKAWDGQDKDKFFKKYNYIHAEQKKNSEERGELNRSKRSPRSFGDDRGKGKFARDSYQSSKDRKERDREKKELRRFSKDRSFGQEEEDKPSLFRPNLLLQYIYGSGPVKAVLQGNKRSIISKLYTSDSAKDAKPAIIDLAKERQIPIEYGVAKLKMNLMSNNGVHNKYIVETRPLVIPDIIGLGSYDEDSGEFETVSYQYNQTTVTRHAVNRVKKTHPLGIFIDEVTDPHNFGAILRSAYYLGVDFVVYAEKNCASLSPVVAKTSAGMLDHVPMFNAGKPLQFFDMTKQNGWNVIATVADPVKSDRGVIASELKLMLEEKPCLLVLGSEGEGLRKSLLDRCTHLVSLRGSQDSAILDSLNVSVASALLLSKFYDADVFDY